MATYVISDIHGQLEAFRRMLTEIKFDIAKDELYLLGDYVDWGPNSIELIQQLIEMTKHENVVCLIGNHEVMMYNIIKNISMETTMSDIAHSNLSGKLELWFMNSGFDTLESYLSLKKTDRDAIRSWVGKLRYFIPDLKVNGNNFYLCHSKPMLKGMSYEDVVWLRMKADRISNQFIQRYPNTTVISGHTIVKNFKSFDSRGKCKIFKPSNIPYINIDCGAKCLGKRDYARLACLKLDDMTEYYVE